jgi:hypothetical protein
MGPHHENAQFEIYAGWVSPESCTPEVGNPKLDVSRILTVLVAFITGLAYCMRSNGLESQLWADSDTEGIGTSLIASNWSVATT